MNIQFIDLAAQQQLIKDKIDARVKKVLAHGKYILGPEVGEFEEKAADYLGVQHVISCANGTDALILALMANNVGPGDAIFTTPFTFFATAEAIALLGAKPVFVDVIKETRNISPQLLKEAIEATKKEGKLKPKGILPVDLFGLPADYGSINQIAKENNLFVLEDAAQAFGASLHGKKTGNLTDIATTSFFPAKPLGCYGDGGAVFTNDDAQAIKLKSLRVHGQGGNKYDNDAIGLNSRLDTLQAAILIEKLAIFSEEVKKRNEVSGQYSAALKGIVETPVVPANYGSVWAQYSVLTKERDILQSALKEKGIPSVVYYPKPLHLQDAFKALGNQSGDFPISESLAETILCLPMHPYLKDEEITYITKCIKKFFKP